MKIITNKEYEYLMKCKDYYEEYVKNYKKAGRTESARLARARYWKKNKKRFGAMKAEQYRLTHPDAKKYIPRNKNKGV